MQSIRKLIQRLRSDGFLSTVEYLLFTVILEKLGVQIDLILRYRDVEPAFSERESFKVQIVDSTECINDESWETLIAYGGKGVIDEFSRAFDEKQHCALNSDNGHVTSVCWFRRQEHELYPDNRVYLIWRCFTIPEFRGRGLFPRTTYQCCRYIREDLGWSGEIIVEVSLFNKSSLHGTQHAGFEAVSKRLTIGGWSRLF